MLWSEKTGGVGRRYARGGAASVRMGGSSFQRSLSLPPTPQAPAKLDPIVGTVAEAKLLRECMWEWGDF